jgi:hypothetical protein
MGQRPFEGGRQSFAVRPDHIWTFCLYCIAKNREADRSMRWVTARELEDWARSTSARDALPKIVCDLILASSADITTIRFPGGDKGQVRGFDGVLVSETQGLNVPQGKSYWEIGTNEDYKDKARRDFEKRTMEVSAEEQADITLVLVSPWTWDSSDPRNKREDWLAARKVDSAWKDVWYIDGSMMETWLEQRPAVAALHARHTFAVKPQEGIRSTDEYWREFAGQFNPMLTEEVLLCEREEAAKQLVDDLLQPSNTVSLVADSPDEVVAFAIAAIRKAPEHIRDFLEARTLVVDSMEGGRQLLANDNLVLLLRNGATRSPPQFSAVGPVLVALGRTLKPGGTGTLPRPSGFGLGRAMMSMGLEEHRALSFARGSGRSLTVLARLIPSGSFDNPTWINEGPNLVPAILAGAWDATNPHDCAIVEQIAGGTSYPQIERLVRTSSGHADPPFDRVGAIWKVRAPMDAIVRVGRFIGALDASLLREAMLKVFGQLQTEPDPDMVVSFSSPNPTGYSEWLRDGLTTTLLLFAVWSAQAEINLGSETGQEFANRVLNELPGLRTDPRVLMSLKDELPMLAEAAPDPLLGALEHMLEGDGALIRPIFNEHEGFLHPIYKHTGVLWALETMAWDPEYFRRAVLALAKLATIDPGVKLGNTPANSLAEIFVLWHPNTNASSAQLLSALDEIARSFPSVGWKLVTSLLPSWHRTSGPTAKPKLREAAGRSITYRELWENEAEVARLAVKLAGRDESRWLDLLPRISAFAPPERQTAIEGLDQAMSNAGPESLKRLWEKLRDEVGRHESFHDADWALPQDQLAPLQALAAKYTPTDPITPVAALFGTRALDYTGDFTKGSQERRAGLLRLYHDVGPEAILRLAGSVRVPYLIIEAIGAAGLTATQIGDLLSRSLREDPGSSLTRGLSGIFRQKVGAEDAEVWLREAAVNGSLSAEDISTLLQAWPDGRETWSAVRRFGPECVTAYWMRRTPGYLTGTRRALLQRNLMFLRFGRAVEAIQSSLNRINEVPTELLFRMLDSVIPELNSRGTPIDTMTSYYIEKALEALDGRADAPNEQIAAREYSFLPLLEFGGRSLRVHHLMAHDPVFYHKILRDVFRGNNEKEVPDARDDGARARWRLSYSLLRNFSTIPGRTPTGVDAQELRSWINSVLELGRETDRIAVTENYIGRLLAHSPPDADGGWPDRCVRDEIERIQSVELERGVQLGRYNMRGVHGKPVFEGGDQERKLAEENRRYAAIATSWPRTSVLLTAIAKGWERDAERADLEAAQRKLRS